VKPEVFIESGLLAARRFGGCVLRCIPARCLDTGPRYSSIV
jgi:hypothetical protein